MPKLAWLSSSVTVVVGLNPSRVLEWFGSSDGSSIRLFCRPSPFGPLMILPPLIFPSNVFRMSLSSGLVPSTMTPPLRFFHVRATSSKTFSARPSSLHPEPQCLPTKVASSCNAEDVSVKLCFLVKVRNANGRSVAGGRIIGRTAALAGAGGWKGFSGCAGVAKAGEDDGIAFEGAAAFGPKKGGGGGFALFSPLLGLCCWSFRGLFRGLCMGIILPALCRVSCLAIWADLGSVLGDALSVMSWE